MNSTTKILVAINFSLLIALIIFIWAVFTEIQIDMSSVGVVSFGLIAFPIAFVLVNMGALNRRFPFTPNRPVDDVTHRDEAA